MSNDTPPGTDYVLPEGQSFTGPLTVATDADGVVLLAVDARGRAVYARAGIETHTVDVNPAELEQLVQRYLEKQRADRFIQWIENL